MQGRQKNKPQYLVSEAGRWDWQMALDRRGYGKVRDSGRTRFAHREAREIAALNRLWKESESTG